MTIRTIPITLNGEGKVAAMGPLSTAPMQGSITHAYHAMVSQLVNLKPPRVTGFRADPADCQDLADHLASITDIYREYVVAAIVDFNQYTTASVELDDFEAGLNDLVADYIVGPLMNRADQIDADKEWER